MWTIRKTVRKGDYLYAVVPEHPRATSNGYVLEHRVLMENKLNRLLETNEEVHHIDGDRHNNTIENLEVVSRGEHQRLHMKLRFPKGRTMIAMVCDGCGTTFEREKRNSHPEAEKHFCKQECYWKFLKI